MIYLASLVKDNDRSLPVPPKILIEIMSDWNYTEDGEYQMKKKLDNSFATGLEVAWVVHPGVKSHPCGVQAMVGRYDADAPLWLGDEELADAGLNLAFTAREALEECTQ